MRIEKALDQEYEDKRLTRTEDTGDSWQITSEDGWSFSLPKVAGIEPRVGSIARYYGEGIGRPVRGVDIDGHEVFYRTEAEEQERHRQWVEDSHRGKREKAEAERERTASRIAALPEALRRRIQKFSDTNPDFWWDFLPYELFCCEEAVKIERAMRDEVPDGSFKKALDEFHDLPYEEQKRFADLDDGHSGNTFGMACRLAYWLLTDPEMVVREHGALVPLVGCRDYGCPHPEVENASA